MESRKGRNDRRKDKYVGGENEGSVSPRQGRKGGRGEAIRREEKKEEAVVGRKERDVGVNAGLRGMRTPGWLMDCIMEGEKNGGRNCMKKEQGWKKDGWKGGEQQRGRWREERGKDGKMDGWMRGEKNGEGWRERDRKL